MSRDPLTAAKDVVPGTGGRPAADLDIVTMQLIERRLTSIADEMMYTLVRTARSTAAVHEYDCSAALLDASGALLAQGQASAGHMGAMRAVVPSILAKFGAHINPGDVFIVNDPREGGMHLPDIYAVKPVFDARVLVAFAGTLIHHVDVGGRTPGGVAPDARSIFEEGLSIPIVKLYERGRINRTAVEFMRANVRMPDTLLGDIQGQVAACAIGEEGVLALVAEHGRVRLGEYVAYLFDYTERLTRAIITSWPDGEYCFVDHLDDDGISGKPVRFEVRVVIAGDEVTIDFTGTSPQVQGAFNGSEAHTVACAMIPVRYALATDIPSNDGYFRPVRVIVPAGSIGNPRHPAARGARGATGRRLEEVVLGALGKALPGLLPACPAGDVDMLRFGRVLADGQSQVVSDNVWGVPGGRPSSDGPDGLATSGRSIANVPVELLERSFPLRVLRYGFCPDTGGAGRFRGGLAIEREWEILADEVSVTVRSDRRRFPPWGVASGAAGSPSSNQLYCAADRSVTELASKINRTLYRGDRLVHRTAGGGGYGSVAQRDPDAVRSDVREGKLTIEAARTVYGVTIAPNPCAKL
jgi:N-methylhydantoinase B